eukprot:6189295-Pleurochrysis_carterae.AAC.1
MPQLDIIRGTSLAARVHTVCMSKSWRDAPAPLSCSLQLYRVAPLNFASMLTTAGIAQLTC